MCVFFDFGPYCDDLGLLEGKWLAEQMTFWESRGTSQVFPGLFPRFAWFIFFFLRFVACWVFQRGYLGDIHQLLDTLSR